MIGRQQLSLELNDDLPDKSDLTNIMSNAHVNDHFHSLAREVSSFVFLEQNMLLIFVINSARYKNCFSWILWSLKLQKKYIKLG